jgi:hypothetical protein
MQEPFAPHGDVDPSMPPLVERPYDPLTDGFPGPQFAPSLDPNAPSIPPMHGLAPPSHFGGIPRLSINTLDKLHMWEAERVGGQDVSTPTEPHSPWETATPPPLSANSAFGGELSMPGTPADGPGADWTWFTASDHPTPTSGPASQEMPPLSPEVWNAFAPSSSTHTNAPTPAPYNAPTPYTGFEYSSAPTPTPAPVATPTFTPSLSKMLAHTPTTPAFRVEFGFDYFPQHAQAVTSPGEPSPYAPPPATPYAF